MPDDQASNNLPAPIVEALSGIPKALLPASLKALDRLVGAAIDIPVAWLGQHKAKIDAQTEAYKSVEAAIAKTAATEAGADSEIVQRALDVLVRKQYRKQSNREAVATAMIEDLSVTPGEQHSTGASASEPPTSLPLDEDWLNVFERYAEDASTERMQKLWGRVIAGEVRKPGRYSLRTLRFLSEFSQADALTFAEFANNAFSDFAPKKLVSAEGQDIRQLIYLESSGLIQGATGFGLSRNMTFNSQGLTWTREGTLIIFFRGAPNGKVESEGCVLTPLGQELVSLLPGRDPRAAARRVATAIRSPEIESAQLCVAAPNDQWLVMETFWSKDTPSPYSTNQAP